MKIIKTADGTDTLYLEDLDETYHSRHGALQESMHVFIKNGFRYQVSLLPDRQLNILEIGLGTGLNALLTCIESKKYRIPVEYTALEPFPVSDNYITDLNYLNFISNPSGGEYLDVIHNPTWDQPLQIHDFFIIKKMKIRYQDYLAEKEYFSLVYYDAFAPNKQPEMWELELLKKSFELMTDKGVLVTYSAKGQFKRDLTASGFLVSTLPGPPGKKEMIRAEKPYQSS